MNIKPVMFKVKYGVKFTSDERNKIVQFYLEVSNIALTEEN